MSSERVPMTREQFDKLKAEVDRMQSAEMIEVTKRVAAARAMGDLSENAEYHAAREDQGMLQARIDRAKDRLARAVIVDPSVLPSGTVLRLGSGCDLALVRSLVAALGGAPC